MAALIWYRSQRAGLEQDLLDCVDAALTGMQRHPFLGMPVAESVRRVLIRRFPYSIFYQVDGKTIEVVGFRHSRRRPFA